MCGVIGVYIFNGYSVNHLSDADKIKYKATAFVYCRAAFQLGVPIPDDIIAQYWPVGFLAFRTIYALCYYHVNHLR